MPLKKCVQFVVMLAFVLVTTPTLGHAALGYHHPVKAVPAAYHQSEDGCGQHGGMTQPSKSGNAPAKSCCDKTCQCLGACNAAVKVLGQQMLVGFTPVVSKTQFSLWQDGTVSGLSGRIKRPPRA